MIFFSDLHAAVVR